MARRLAAGGEGEARAYLARQPDVDPTDHDQWLAAAAELVARETIACSVKQLERRVQRMAIEILVRAVR